MGKLKIPQNQQKIFAQFLDLTPEARDGLVSAILEADLGASPKDIAVKLQSSDENGVDYAGIVEAFFNLFRALSSSFKETDYVKELFEALNYYKDDVKKIPGLTQQLNKLLDRQSKFYLTAKAIELAHERERLLMGADILTDIRPVFDDIKESDVVGMVVMHTLKIHYHEGSDHKEVLYALDEKDLMGLKIEIDKALAVSGSLRNQFQNSGLPFIIPREGAK